MKNWILFALVLILSLNTVVNAAECVCTQEYAPVCGTDGATYSNKCLAECKGIKVAYSGECKAIAQLPTSSVTSCVVDESLQKEINSLMTKLQDAEKSGDAQLMTEIKQKIELLSKEVSVQNQRCQQQVQTQVSTTIPLPTPTSVTGTEGKTEEIEERKVISEVATPVSPSTQTTTTATNITSTCIDESIIKQWTELATQLEAAVEDDETELASQLGQKLEALGQQVVEQLKEKCASYTSNVPLVKFFCPTEAAFYAFLEKKLNSIKAQEYQARTGGDTELALQLQAQITSLTNESAKWTEKCQAKLLASDAAKYFMTTTTSAYISPTSTTKQAQQVPGVISSSETTVTAVPTTTTPSTQIAVASVCYVPYELEKKLKEALNEYYSLVQTNGTVDMEKMKQVKETISNTGAEIDKIKQNCQPQANVTAVTTEKICPVVMSPDFEQKCAARNGTITKNFDDRGCLSSYDCVTSAGIISPTPTATPQPTAPGQVIRPGENCTVPVELTQEFEGLWKNYKEALSNNDTQKAEAFKTKISEIEKKISETKGQCVKTIVTESVETGDVVSYYRQKVTGVMTQEGDMDKQIEQLKQLRSEIDNMIAELIKKKNVLNASEVSGIVDEIKIRPNQIQAGNATVNTTEATIITQIANKSIEVKPSETGVEIRDKNITASSSAELTIKDNKVKVGDIEIKIAPSAVAGKAKVQKVKELNLTIENNIPVYEVTGEENRKLLWVIPVTIEKQATVDASTGTVVKEEKPWWSALTVSVD